MQNSLPYVKISFSLIFTFLLHISSNSFFFTSPTLFFYFFQIYATINFFLNLSPSQFLSLLSSSSISLQFCVPLFLIPFSLSHAEPLLYRRHTIHQLWEWPCRSNDTASFDESYRENSISQYFQLFHGFLFLERILLYLSSWKIRNFFFDRMKALSVFLNCNSWRVVA